MKGLQAFFSFPFRVAGALVRIAGRVTIGIAGFVTMGGGLLCIEPLAIHYLGVPLVIVGLLLLVKAIF